MVESEKTDTSNKLIFLLARNYKVKQNAARIYLFVMIANRLDELQNNFKIVKYIPRRGNIYRLTSAISQFQKGAP